MKKIWSVSFGLMITLAGIAAPKFEMRGVWVATVKNIDWPSKPGLSSEEQKKEAIGLLDMIENLNFNTIFLQVRPTSDAFFKSELEPWSVYLTGEPGKAPEPNYDPLAFWIEEAHKRNIDLHAWINPFRATMSVDEELADRHPVKLHPEWFINYNNKYQYDPGNPACRSHIAEVIKDLVSRYNIDGIHFDDYFYPYPVAGKEFNDSASFKAYCREQTGADALANWRRSNVEATIRLVRKTIKSIKPYVAFGISPFGVWRNKDKDNNGSDTKAGITNYDHLYADVLKWMKEGNIDYVVPQIYWDTQHPTANFNILTDWWSRNCYNTPLIIGHAIYRINNETNSWANPSQMTAQLRTVRSNPNICGSSMYSIRHLKRDLLGLQDSLKQFWYSKPALIPVIAKPDEPVKNMTMFIRKRFSTLKWGCDNNSDLVKKYVVYLYQAKDPDPTDTGDFILSVTHNTKFKIPKGLLKSSQSYFIKIEAIDLYNRPCGMSLPVKCKKSG